MGFAKDLRTTLGLPKACNVLASPINKIILVVRLGPKLKKIDGLRQALNVSGNRFGRVTP
jgi:hypothetical protein